MSLGGFFFRKRDYPPAEATFDIAARVRVEPEAVAPAAEASGTFDVLGIARVDMLGEIPPIPAAPTGNAFNFTHVAAVGGPRDGFTTNVASEGEQTWSNNDPSITDVLRVQEATNVGFTTGLVEDTLGGADSIKIWTNQKDGVTRYYRVRAENGSGNSEWSNVVSVKHIEDPPGAPQNLVVDSLTSGSLRFQWTAPISGGSVSTYKLVDDESVGATDSSSPGAIAGLDEGSGHSVAMFAVGPDNQAGPLTSYLGRAVRHATPGLSGCVQLGVNHTLDIDDSASFRAQNNTSVKVYRDAALYDTIPDGDQLYEPAHQSGSWYVISAGGTASTPKNGSVAIPDSAKSTTITMPFSGAC